MDCLHNVLHGSMMMLREKPAHVSRTGEFFQGEGQSGDREGT